MVKSIPCHDIKDYLKVVVDMKKSIEPEGILPYHGFEDFVLQHGKEYVFQPKPKGVRWGVQKGCFCNAARLVLNNPYDLTYVEGYATSVIPIMHAWAVTKDGIVVDNTWRHEDEQRSYYGVPFDFNLLTAMLCAGKVFGLLDNVDLRWPLLQVKYNRRNVKRIIKELSEKKDDYFWLKQRSGKSKIATTS